jgi:hypothetical protein
MELRILVYEQHHVWRSLRGLPRTVPLAAARNGECACGGGEPRVWYHGQFLVLIRL